MVAAVRKAVSVVAAITVTQLARSFVSAEDTLVQAEAFARDDECSSDDVDGCALNALQVRGASAEPSINEEDAVIERFDSLELPEDWDTGAGNGVALVDASSQKSEWASCKDNPDTKFCYLYRKCRGPKYCVVNGYLIVPGFAVPGMEAVKGQTAHSYDYLFWAAKKVCGGPSCVLLINPMTFRSQDQMHIHARHFTPGGAKLKAELEKQLCGTHGWKTVTQTLKKCASSKASLYDKFPRVFSTVDSAFGGGSLANVGIMIFFTKECGGYKTIVLTTTGCSLEHSVSTR